MVEITTGTPTVISSPPIAAPVSALKKVENTVFSFLQAHYAKLIAAVVGFAASHFGLLGKFI
jgi:hypothetical protein